MDAVKRALEPVNFPPTLPLITYQVVLGPAQSPLELRVIYLGDRDLQPDAQAILSEQIKTSLQPNNVQVQYQRIAQQQGTMAMPIADPETVINRDGITFSPQEKIILDKIGQLLQTHPNLNLRLTVERDANRNPASLFAQTEALRNYWQRNWDITGSRIQETNQITGKNQFQFSLVLANDDNAGLTETPQVNTANPISPPSPRVNPRENGVF
jgi:hypothetical protein